MGVETPFRRELETLVNRCSMENGSNTPDFILAQFLVGCLAAFDHAVNERTAWYDPKIRAGAATETFPGVLHWVDLGYLDNGRCPFACKSKGMAACRLPYDHDGVHKL